MPTSTATICVIDDNLDNLDLLEQELGDAGYRVVTAGDGRTGLEVIARESPDLVLLDIMMPGLSGHDVCRALRQGDATEALPIIFITAKSGTRDEVVGLDAGANDYVVKPINIQTLLARVRTQLRIKALQDELRRNYESFMRNDQTRQRMISMVAHDLKTPLMTVSASAKLLLEKQTRESGEHLERITGLLLKSTQKMQELVEDFLSFAQWEHCGLALEIEVCDLRAIVDDVVAIFSPLIHERRVTVHVDLPVGAVLVFSDRVLIGRVWQNLLSNAIKYNRPGGEVTLAAAPAADGHVVCHVRDTGIGIPAAVLPRVFDSFFRPSGRKEIEGTGLGLAVVRAILEVHRSAYRIDSEVNVGTDFVFNLPMAPSAEASPPTQEGLRPHPLGE